MKNLFKALADFQQECPIIHKGTTGYGYSYSSLPEILQVINPILKKNKLGFTQGVEDDKLSTTIFHTESGESITTSATIPQNVELKGMNQFQVLGSAITYMRRYQLSSMLGIVTDKDTDASGEQVTPSKSTQTSTSGRTNQAAGSDLPWLNEGTPEWGRAEILVGKEGFESAIVKIKQHYKVSKEAYSKLKEIAV